MQGPASPHPDQPLLGIGAACLGMLALTAQEAIFKWLMALGYPLSQLLLARSLLMMLFMIAVLWPQGALPQLRARRPRVVVLRAVLLLISFIGYFNGLRLLPLADTVVLAFGAPLFVALMSAPLLGEAVGRARLFAVLAGFVGVVIAARPSGDADALPALMVVGASATYALCMVLTRSLRASESSACLVFWTASVFALGGAPLALVAWRPVALFDAASIFALAAIAAAAHLLLTQAYRVAPPAVVAPFEYTSLIWAVLFGFLLWGDVPAPHVLIGALVVIAAGLVVLRGEVVAGRANDV